MHALNAYTLNRRDDMESIGYTFFFLLDPEKITWKDCRDQKEIYDRKIEFISQNDPQTDEARFLIKFIKTAYEMPYY